MSNFTIMWIVWGVAFAVIEGIALFNSRAGDTLSEHVWAWTGIARRALWQRHDFVPPIRPSRAMLIARAVVAVSTVWLALHLTTGLV